MTKRIIAVAFDNTASFTPIPPPKRGVSDSGDEMLKRGKDIAAMGPYWEKVTAITDGIEGMRLAGDKLLSKFDGETEDDFKNRLQLTKMTNVYLDVAENLASKPFEKEVTLLEDDNNDVPEPLQDFIEDVDGNGSNLTQFAGDVFFNGINNVIDWILIDYPVDDGSVKTVADAQKANIRPYWSRVLATNMLIFREKRINGKSVLVFARFLEPGEPDHIREFEREDSGAVVWRLYEKKNTPAPENDKTFFHLIDDGVVSIGVIPMVPFFTGRREGLSFKFHPPLRSSVELQIDLYQDESALKFAKTMTGYAMLTASGVKPEKDARGDPKPVRVGPNKILYAPPNGDGSSGEWKYIEPSATSLKFLAEDIQNTIKELRELGRQPLTAQSGNLTVISARQIAGKSRSTVATWALLLKNTLENALVITDMWLGIDAAIYDPTVYVFLDFDNIKDDGTDIAALNSARDRGDISQETYLEEYKRRDVLSSDFDFETERDRLMKELPADGADNSLDGLDGPPAKPGTQPQKKPGEPNQNGQ